MKKLVEFEKLKKFVSVLIQSYRQKNFVFPCVKRLILKDTISFQWFGFVWNEIFRILKVFERERDELESIVLSTLRAAFFCFLIFVTVLDERSCRMTIDPVMIQIMETPFWKTNKNKQSNPKQKNDQTTEKLTKSKFVRKQKIPILLTFQLLIKLPVDTEQESC